jgi:antirestriction protein ArdC
LAIKTYSRKDRNEAVEELLKKVEAGTKAVYESERYKEMLICMAKFHSYSANNIILIASQRPNATLVCGYKGWQQKFNRTVKKGEKGIQILGFAPKTITVEQEKKDELGFTVYDADGKPEMEEVKTKLPAYKPMYVFDIDQTEGEPLPTIYNGALQGSVRNYEAFQEALAELSPVPIHFEAFAGEAMGYYDRVDKSITVKEGLSELQTMKTLVHEIAHAQMHALAPDKPDYVPLDQATKELEAESVAFICCAFFDLDTSDYSFPYLAGWANDKELKALHSSLERIRSQAVENITFLENKLEQTLNTELPENTFTIYQVKSSKRMLRFANMKELLMNHQTINPNNYELIFSGTLEDGVTLEDLYVRFNEGKKPEGYHGHSMSVSDVVVLKQNGVETAHFCDSIGFVEVSQFLNVLELEKPMSLAERLSAAKSAVQSQTSPTVPQTGQTQSR